MENASEELKVMLDLLQKQTLQIEQLHKQMNQQQTVFEKANETNNNRIERLMKMNEHETIAQDKERYVKTNNLSINQSIDQDNVFDDEQSEQDSYVSADAMSSKGQVEAIRPAPFSGAAGPARVDTWKAFKIQLALYIEALCLNKKIIDENQKVNTTMALMAAPAIFEADRVRRNLLAQAPMKKLSFDAFMSRMDLVYLAHQVNNVHDKIFHITQIEGESVSTYYDRFSSLHAEVTTESSMPRDVSVNLFAKGLFKALQRHVDYKRTADQILSDVPVDQPEEAVLKCFYVALAQERDIIASGRQWLLTHNTTKKQTQLNSSSHRRENKASSWAPSTVAATNNIAPAPAQAAPSTNNRSTPVQSSAAPASTKPAYYCYTCNGQGHVSKYCRNKPPQASLNMYDALNNSESESKN
jgi:hypothetical protein